MSNFNRICFCELAHFIVWIFKILFHYLFFAFLKTLTLNSWFSSILIVDFWTWYQSHRLSKYGAYLVNLHLRYVFWITMDNEMGQSLFHWPRQLCWVCNRLTENFQISLDAQEAPFLKPTPWTCLWILMVHSQVTNNLIDGRTDLLIFATLLCKGHSARPKLFYFLFFYFFKFFKCLGHFSPLPPPQVIFCVILEIESFIMLGKCSASWAMPQPQFAS
jgi:hypothetical protein